MKSTGGSVTSSGLGRPSRRTIPAALYPLLIQIPPIDEKGGNQSSFDPEFLEKRMFYLQEFLFAVCDHPDLRLAPAFDAFLSIKDEAEFDKYKKSLEKISNPNGCVASSGVNKKLFYLKNPIKVDHVINPFGETACRIGSNLKTYSNSLSSILKEMIPGVNL